MIGNAWVVMSFLTVILHEQPMLEIQETDSPVRVNVGHSVFFEIPQADTKGLFLGFYDWLRTPVEAIVGLRITFHDGRKLAIETVQRCQVGEWEASDIYCLKFRPHAAIVQSLSIDQEFSVSRIYRGPNGEVALLLDINGVEGEFAPGLIR